MGFPLRALTLSSSVVLLACGRNRDTSDAAVASVPQAAASMVAVPIDPNQEGVDVLISRTHIILDDEAVVDLDGSRRIDAKDLRPGSRLVVPLARKTKQWRDRDKLILGAKGQPTTRSSAIIIADAATPYDVLLDVLFTLGQTEFGEFHFLVLVGSDAGEPPKAPHPKPVPVLPASVAPPAR